MKPIQATVLPPASQLDDLTSELMGNNGKIKLLSAEQVKKYDWESFRLFCHKHARYGFPTIELIDYLKTVIGDRKAIEVGAGAGDLGYHLGIKMTDSKQQQNPLVKLAYAGMGQPTINYPDDVEKLEALEAVYKYKPKVIVGSWITTFSKHPTDFNSNPWGVNENKLLKMCETLILIGNAKIHDDKPIRQYEHKTIYSPWIISRAAHPELNCIYIWDKRNEKNSSH